MVIVLGIRDRLLYLYSSTTEAEAELEAQDVENGEYEFCDDLGQRLVGKITSPVTAFKAGGFRLVPEGVPDRAILDSFISRASILDRGCNGVITLDELRRLNHG
jgi:hypothetical protein